MALLRRVRDPLARRSLFERMFDEPMLRTEWWLDGDERDRLMGAIPLDVYEDDGAIEVRASMPGLKPEDIHIDVIGDELRIRGEVAEEREREEDRYHLRELRTGRIERRVRLPQTVDTDAATATFDEGVLTLKLPVIAEQRSHEIPVGRGPSDG